MDQKEIKRLEKVVEVDVAEISLTGWQMILASQSNSIQLFNAIVLSHLYYSVPRYIAPQCGCHKVHQAIQRRV